MWRNREYEKCFGTFASWIVDDGRKRQQKEDPNCTVPDWVQKPGNRSVSIVRFGLFQLEKVTMPAGFEDLRTGYLHTDYDPVLEGSRGEAMPYQFDVGSNTLGTLDKLKRNRYNDNREIPGPPAMLELWYFALRHCLNLGLMSGMFWMPRRDRYDQASGGEKWVEGRSSSIQIGLLYKGTYLELFHGTISMFEGGLGGSLLCTR